MYIADYRAINYTPTNIVADSRAINHLTINTADYRAIITVCR